MKLLWRHKFHHVAYVSASMLDVMGHSIILDEWCDQETSKMLLHTKSIPWLPDLALLLACFIAIYQIILSKPKGSARIPTKKCKKACLKISFKRCSLPYYLVFAVIKK